MSNIKFSRNIVFVAIILSFYACGGGEGNSGSIVTEIDSTTDSTIILHEDQIEATYDQSPLDPGNAIQVQEGDSSFWEDFRNELQAQPDAIGEGFHFGETEVATAWQRLNDKYSYQTVYRYSDNGLWLQTYYRGNNATSATDSLSNEPGQLLTKEAAQDPELQKLWNQMEERASSLNLGKN